MDEQQGVIRVNVSVPKALKARMDAVADQANWSAVATAAFEVKVLEIESAVKVEGLDDVVTRMRAEEELSEKADYQNGFAAGRQWAKTEATVRHFRNVYKATADPSSWTWAHVLDEYGMNHGIAHGLYADLHNRN